MKVTIDEKRCQGHLRCMTHAPEVFGCDEEGHGLVLVDVVLEQFADVVREAVELCPERAISAE
jgi:ferredoxin